MRSFWCPCLTLFDLPMASYGIFKFLQLWPWGAWRKLNLASFANPFKSENFYWWLLRLWGTHWCKKSWYTLFTDSPKYGLMCPTNIIKLVHTRPNFSTYEYKFMDNSKNKGFTALKLSFAPLNVTIAVILHGLLSS